MHATVGPDKCVNQSAFLAKRKVLLRTVVRRTDLAKLRGGRKEEGLEGEGSSHVQCVVVESTGSLPPVTVYADEDERDKDVEEAFDDAERTAAASPE